MRKEIRTEQFDLKKIKEMIQADFYAKYGDPSNILRIPLQSEEEVPPVKKRVRSRSLLAWLKAKTKD